MAGPASLGLAAPSSTVRDVTIRHLEFDTHHRAVGLTPDSDSPTFLCEDYFSTDGSARGVVVERSRFVNNRRAVQSFGEVRGFRFRDNVFEDNLDFGVLLVSEAVGCFLPDGSPGPGFPIGTSLEARVAGNRLVGTESVAVLLDASTTGNTVIATDFELSVVDEGAGNVVVGTLARDHDPGAHSPERLPVQPGAPAGPPPR